MHVQTSKFITITSFNLLPTLMGFIARLYPFYGTTPTPDSQKGSPYEVISRQGFETRVAAFDNSQARLQLTAWPSNVAQCELVFVYLLRFQSTATQYTCLLCGNTFAILNAVNSCGWAAHCY